MRFLAIPSGIFTATAGTALGANRGTVAVNDNATLLIGGTFNNFGEISLTSFGDPTSLLISRDTTLKGGGTVLMTDSSGNTIGSNNNSYSGPTLTNVDNTIAGAGQIGGYNYNTGTYNDIALINEKAGIINATGANNQLQINYTVTNSGLLEATGSAGLRLFASVTNTGRIYAGPNSLVNLSYVNNTGGDIYAAPNSVVTLGTVLGGTLEGSGTFAVQDGTTASLQGAINDLGTITLQSTGDPTTLVMSAWYKYIPGVGSTLVNPTLTGGGNILLSGPNSQITGYGTFVNAGITVSGQGVIGGSNLVLNNQTKGLIDANSDSPLIIDTGAKTIINSGTMRADFVGELLIASNLKNTGTLNANSGTILVAGTVSGTGTAVVNGTGQVEFGAASSNGVKFAVGSTGELILDDSKHYTGTISGFGTNTTQSVDLTDIDFATATKSYANGTLTVKDGVGDIAHIKFSGTHTLASFNLQDDGQGGVLITDPPVQSKPQTSNVAALFGNYIASMFASASNGHGAIPTSWMDAPLPHLMSLPHA